MTQNILQKRGIEKAALNLQWVSANNPYDNKTPGWSYPVFCEEGIPISDLLRWKSADSAASPKYVWFPDREERDKASIVLPTYYTPAGLKKAIEASKGQLHFVSGEPDMLTLRTLGFQNATCAFGERSIGGLVEFLTRMNVKRLIYWRDQDDTGLEAAQAICDALDGSDIVFECRAINAREKGYDLNRLWIDSAFDRTVFIEAMKAALKEKLTPSPKQTPTAPKNRPESTSDDLYERWCVEVENEAVKRWNLNPANKSGYSQHIACPMKPHDKDTNSAHWNYQTHGLQCFGACGKHYDTKQVAEVLFDRSWQDLFAEFRERNKPVRTSAQKPKSKSAPKREPSRPKVTGQNGKTSAVSGKEAADRGINIIRGDVVSDLPPIHALYRPLWQFGGRVEWWTPRQVMLLISGSGMGKEQPNSANVKTLNGWKRMGDIQPGDQIASVNGNRSVVMNIFPQGEKNVYKITFSDGRIAYAGADHLWEIRMRAGREWKIETTDDIRKRLEGNDERVRPQKPVIRLVSGDFGHHHALLIDPWLLGFLIGDGCFSAKKCSPTFSTPDAEILTRVREILPDHLLIKKCGPYDYRVSSTKSSRSKPNELKQRLETLGLWGKLSKDKFIPQVYLNASRGQRLELLRGLIDSDGWVEKHCTLRYATSSKQLADDVQQLVWSLGGLCTRSIKKTQCLDSYVLTIRHDNVESFAWLPKKQARLKNPSYPLTLGIESIEFDRIEESTCIQVSHPSHLYITDNYVVTHNTAFIERICDNGCIEGYDPFLWGPEWTPLSYFYRRISRWGGPSITALEENEAWIYENSLVENNPDIQRLTKSEIHKCEEIHAKVNSWSGDIHYLDRSGEIIELLKVNGDAQREVEKRRAEGRRCPLIVVDYTQKGIGDLTHSNTEKAVESVTNFAGRMGMFAILLSQVNKDQAELLINHGKLFGMTSAQFVSDKQFNAVLTLNPVYNKAKMITNQAWIRSVKNSTNRGQGKILVKTNLARHDWKDEVIQGIESETRADGTAIHQNEPPPKIYVEEDEPALPYWHQ